MTWPDAFSLVGVWICIAFIVWVALKSQTPKLQSKLGSQLE